MFYMGIDLGKLRDHTAIAIVDRKGAAVQLRYAERVALGTPYPEVVERIRYLATHQSVRGRCVVAVDATGLGEPVVDMLRSSGLGCEVSAVNITGGERETRSGIVWNVPKSDLMAGVQVLIEKRELKIAGKLEEADALVRELADVRMTPGNAGRVRIGADRAGEHDDLVMALALACWRAKRVQAGYRDQRLF